MFLRKRPTVTPALLAANRANAAKSTGPRTAEGKKRIVLNAPKHSRHARKIWRQVGGRQVQGRRGAAPMDSGPSAPRVSASWLAGRRTAGGAVGSAGVVRAGAAGASYARLGPAAGEGLGEVSSVERFPVGTALDAPAAGRGRNKPGICREINR